MHAYHVTFEDNFDSIARLGLLPMETSKNNWPSVDNARGVFFFKHFEDAKDWVSFNIADYTMFPKLATATKIILKLDIPDEHETWRDPVYDLAYYSPTRIPAEWITDVIIV